MKLYLLRHGHSPTAHEAGVPTDAERPLSDQGIESLKSTFDELRRNGAHPALIIHSSLKRARQTAQEAQKSFGLSGDLKECPCLSEQSSPEQLFEALLPELIKAGEVLAIGHQPQLGEVTSWLTGRDAGTISPGGVVALEIKESGASSLKGSTAKRLWSFNP